MKFLIVLGLSLAASCSSFADFVYMREDANGKTVQLQSNNDAPTTLNNSSNKLWALYPDISADGNEFVYVEGPGQLDLHLTYFNKAKNLTQKFVLDNKGMLLHPKFSKNGAFIFYSAPGPKGKNTIYFFNRAETVLMQGKHMLSYSLSDARALDAEEESYFPRPSSDAGFVVYQRNTAGKKEIVLFDRIENKKTVLAEGMSPSLSFDERLIAYTAKTDGNWNVFVIDRVTKVVTQMTSDAKDEMAPTFMPDNTLVFASNKSGHYNLHKLVNNKWETLVTAAANEEVDFYSPNFSGEKQYKQGLNAPFTGEPRSSFGTVTHEGKIYMAGGHAGAEHTYPPESFQDTFLVYDIANNTWSELAPRPAKAHGYEIAAFGNYVYAFGGFTYSPDHKPKWKSLAQIDRYNIKENKWETVAKLSSPRSSNVAITIEDKVYIVGGWDSTPKKENDFEGTFKNEIEIFDLKTEKVTVADYKMPAPLRRAFTGIEHNGKILLVGGLGQGSTHFELITSVSEIDPKDGSSKEWPELPFGTFAPAAEILNGELIVFGGMFKTGEWNYEYVSHIYGMSLKDKVWRHTGRYLTETKGFAQVFMIDEKTLGILGGHHYLQGQDTPVTTFETFK